MEDLLRDLQITQKGTYVESKYTIDLQTSNWYQYYFEKLESNPNFEIEEDSIKTSYEENTVAFYNGEYEIYLTANFVDDTYTMEIEEKQ